MACYDSNLYSRQICIEKNYTQAYISVIIYYFEDNLFSAKNDKGVFMVRFFDTEIYEVTFTTNTGFIKTL